MKTQSNMHDLPRVQLIANKGLGLQTVATRIIPGIIIHLDRFQLSEVIGLIQKDGLINPHYVLCSDVGIEWRLNGTKALVNDKWADKLYVLVSDMPTTKSRTTLSPE